MHAIFVRDHEAAAAQIASLKTQVSQTLSTLKAALESGDLAGVESVSSSAVVDQIDSSGTGGAWQGTGPVTLTEPDLDRDAAAEPVIDKLPDAQLAGRSRAEVFGDADYVPTINGDPWTDYEGATPETPSTIKVSWRIGNGQDKCFDLGDGSGAWLVQPATDDCGITFARTDTGEQASMAASSDEASPDDFLTIASRSLADVSNEDTQLLLGTYELEPVDGFSTRWIGFDQDLSSVDLTQPIAFVPTKKALSAAKKHADSAVAVQAAMGNDDPRCNYNFGIGTIVVDKVEVTAQFGCDTYADATKTEVKTWAPDVATPSVTFQDAYDGTLSITYTAKNEDDPVLAVRMWDTLDDEWKTTKYSDVTVTFDLDEHGNATLAHDSKSLDWTYDPN